MKRGDTVYIIETNDTIKEVKVINEAAGFVTVRYSYTGPHYIPGGMHRLSGNGGIRLRRSRVYESRQAAEAFIAQKKKDEENMELIRTLNRFK